MKLTKEQAFLVTAVTKVLSMPFNDFVRMASEKLNATVLVHSLSEEQFWSDLREKTIEEYRSIAYTGD